MPLPNTSKLPSLVLCQFMILANKQCTISLQQVQHCSHICTAEEGMLRQFQRYQNTSKIGLSKKLPAEIETFEHEAEVEMEEQQGGTSDHEVENREGEEENKKVKALFLKSLLEYGEKVSALNDPNSIKAMKAMTRTLKKSMNCNPHTIQQQWGRVINPNPPAIASRLAPGSGPAPLGRRFKDRRGQVVTLQGGQVVRAGN